MPAAGGEESRVTLTTLSSRSAEFFWSTAPTGIYFIDDSKPVLKFFDMATGEQSVVLTLDDWPFCCNPALAVSADGRFLLYNQGEGYASDIMLVDNFR